MATFSVGSEFAQSYAQFDQYPANLIYNTTYQSDLEEYKNDLTSNKRLCIADEVDLDVGFRDFYRSTTSTGAAILQAVNAQDPKAVRACLGDESKILQNQQPGKIVTKQDPICRFIFIWSEHSLSPLLITKRFYQQLLSYHQVMPSYLDFLSVFGRQDELRDLRFSGFREHTFLMGYKSSNAQSNAQLPQKPINPLGPCVPGLNRTGWGYQISLSLKSIVHNAPAVLPPKLKDQKWSIRQAAFHHQFDVSQGTTLWITTSSHNDIQNYIEDLTGRNAMAEDKSFRTLAECFKSTLSVHLLLCHWSTKNWRKYLRWLDDRVREETNEIVLGHRDRDGHKVYDSDDLQEVQILADKVSETKMILESNSQVITSLREYYKVLQESDDFPLAITCKGEIYAFLTKLSYVVSDLKMHVARADLMLKIMNDRKDLLLQHLQSQAAKKMEHLASESQREAIAMRIIAAVTALFLPATFVSTFFSTDVVKFQNPQGGEPSKKGVYSSKALERWFQVTAVLTLITLMPALYWYLQSNRRRLQLFLKNRKNMTLLPTYRPTIIDEKKSSP